MPFQNQKIETSTKKVVFESFSFEVQLVYVLIQLHLLIRGHV